jgi:hypothetical protein
MEHKHLVVLKNAITGDPLKRKMVCVICGKEEVQDLVEVYTRPKERKE